MSRMIIETVEHFVTPYSMLNISGHNAFRALVNTLSNDLKIRRNFLNLVVFWCILAYIRRVCLAGEGLSPGIPTHPHEA